MRIFVVLFCLISSFSLSQNLEQLSINKKKVFTISESKPKSFAIALDKEKNYKIVAEQKGIDIILRLLKEGKEVANQDSPNGKFGPETINLSTKSAGNFTIIIEPLKEEYNSTKGKISIIVEEINLDKTKINALLSPKEMAKDLKIFKEIREKANSGLYIYRTKEQIDSIYNWANSEIKSPKKVSEFYKIISALTDFEGSNHNSTNFPHSIHNYLDLDSYFPFHSRSLDNKMIINNQHSIIPLGSEIIRINGLSVNEIQQKLSKYFTADGYNQTAKNKLTIEHGFGWIYPFEFGKTETFKIEYIKPNTNKVETTILKSITSTENNKLYYNRHSLKFDSIIDFNVQDKYSFHKLNNKSALLNFRIFDMASNKEDPNFEVFSNFLDQVFSQLKEEKIGNLIVDIRGNPGGNDPTYEKVFTYLTDQNFRENNEAYIIFKQLPMRKYYNWSTTDKSNQKRALKDINTYLQNTFNNQQEKKYYQNQKYYQDQKFNPMYYPDKNKFNGKLFLLIDENVGSAASHFASLVRSYSDAIIVGMETSGGYYRHNGHYPIEYVLPHSKINTRFSIVSVLQDAVYKESQPNGRGIIPDHKVSQTIDDFLKNEDTQMKYVLDLIEAK